MCRSSVLQLPVHAGKPSLVRFRYFSIETRQILKFPSRELRNVRRGLRRHLSRLFFAFLRPPNIAPKHLRLMASGISQEREIIITPPCCDCVGDDPSPPIDIVPS
jgi:hypothetical protein